MKKRDGDLLHLFNHGEFDVIIHGCNCYHAMGAGIAGQIAKMHPIAVRMDRENTKLGDMYKLSNYTLAHVGEGRIIVNLYTQYRPGADLWEGALLLGFQKLRKVMDPKARIGIPAIGCGIAGGNWDEIQPKIAEIMSGFDITYVNYVPLPRIPSDIDDEITMN